VSITGGSVLGMTLDPSGNGSDFGYNFIHWQPGDVLTMSAPGDELPGFVLEVTIPTQLDLTFPSMENVTDEEIHISRAAPYVLTWTPTDGTVEVEIEQESVNDEWDLLDLICFFPGEDGTGTLPVEGLEEFRADVDNPEVRTVLWVAHNTMNESELGGRPLLYWGSESRNVLVTLE
jgi:hypothetical protein